MDGHKCSENEDFALNKNNHILVSMAQYSSSSLSPLPHSITT
jgi:hypothetical protein